MTSRITMLTAVLVAAFAVAQVEQAPDKAPKAVSKAVKKQPKNAQKKGVPKPVRAGAQTHIYKTVDGREMRCYIMTPPEHDPAKPRAAIVFFHGGGWVGGAPGQFTEHAKYLSSRGMVTVQAEYRLLDRKSTDTPEVCIQDAKSAMRWVRANAESLGIDPTRIAAGGGSAGGHLAAAVATLDGCNDPQDDLAIDPKPNALVLFNPVYNNGPGEMGWGYQRTKDAFKTFSPAHNITKGMPPAIVFLGTKDKLVPVAAAEKFRDDMKAVGSRSELVLFEGEGHGFFNHGRNGNKPYLKTIWEADRFLTSLGFLEGEPTIPEPVE